MEARLWNIGNVLGIKEDAMINIMQAAHYLVYLSYQNNQYSLTPLKLQKLLYIAQGWSYVWDKHALFQDQFEAWQYGPVNLDVYHYFKKYGRDEIPETEGLPSIRDFEAEETLKSIWSQFGSWNAFQLVEYTHSQTPWVKAYANDGIIRNSDIQKYYQSKY